jgi:phosphatidate phosphatase APP1
VHTGLTRGLEFLRVTLLTDVQDRTPLPGAAALYRALVSSADGAQRPVFYVSTSPWNLHEMLLQFVALRGFPIGPLLLTDWGPSHTGLFRIGAQAHKLGLVRRLLDEHPHLRLVLIGDSGQEDPEIYAALAREVPDRVAAVYIRRTTGIDPVRAGQVDALAAEITAAGVPMLAVDDSAQIAVHAAGIGLLDAGAVDAVRAELNTS